MGSASAARKSAKMQREQIERQMQKEKLKMAEEEDEVARRRKLYASKNVGRRSLISSSGGSGGYNYGV